MSVNSKMTALADAIRAKANYSGKMSIEKMTNKVLSIPTGSSLETVSFDMFSPAPGESEAEGYLVYISQDGSACTKHWRTGNTDEEVTAVVGSCIVLFDNAFADETVTYGFEKIDEEGSVWRVTSEASTFTVGGIREGGSSAELVEFGTYNDSYPKADVTFYYFHPTNGYSSILVEADNAKIWDVAKGSYMSSSIRIKTESEQGIRAVDMDENGYASLFVVEDTASFTIIGAEEPGGSMETCQVGLLCNGNQSAFFVNYVTVEDFGGARDYLTGRRYDVDSGASGDTISNVVKGTVIKVYGVQYCSVDYGDLNILYYEDIDATRFTYYIAVNGSGDLLIG